MCVALSHAAMLLSELAVIYLSAAAPFGVARFLEDHGRVKRPARRLAGSAAHALAWPLEARRLFTEYARARQASRARAKGLSRADESLSPDARRAERVKRSAVNSLREAEDLLLEARGTLAESERHALFAAREGLERYAGLSLACAESREDETPSEREMELCRIAGRAGDDLLLAGLCVHRRGVTRLLAHRERARSELLHALAAACEVARGVEGKRVSGALLRALGRAIELMSLFDDRAAVVSAARLLDAECARLRRLEAEGARARRAAPEGAEPCTTRAAHTAFATRPPRTPTHA
jgi:hypothetical protein